VLLQLANNMLPLPLATCCWSQRSLGRETDLAQQRRVLVLRSLRWLTFAYVAYVCWHLRWNTNTKTCVSIRLPTEQYILSNTGRIWIRQFEYLSIWRLSFSSGSISASAWSLTVIYPTDYRSVAWSEVKICKKYNRITRAKEVHWAEFQSYK